MRLVVLAAIVGVLAGATMAVSAPIGRDSARHEGEIAIFYYPWYGTPARDGGWQHWGQNRASPPNEIASAYYPAAGAYSSSDPTVVQRQMREIAGAGIDTVVVSWWGPGSPESKRLPDVARFAETQGLRVAVHIEPYGNRTPTSVASDIGRLMTLGVTDFYVYDSSTMPAAEWKTALATVPKARVFAHTHLPGKAAAGGFDGLYTYDVIVHDGTMFPRMCRQARKLRLLCAPSVGPGFNAIRATGNTWTRGRRHGATYDHMWTSALRARADVVTVTSYNEWHEGTQIEPAQAFPGYATYDGAWGLDGELAERAYLDRTTYWAGKLSAQIERSRTLKR